MAYHVNPKGTKMRLTNFWWLKTYLQIALGCNAEIPLAILFNLDDVRLSSYASWMFLDHFDLPKERPDRHPDRHPDLLVICRRFVDSNGVTQLDFTMPGPRVFKSLSHRVVRAYKVWWNRSAGCLTFTVGCHWESFNLSFNADQWSLLLRDQLAAHRILTNLERELLAMPLKLVTTSSRKDWDFGFADEHIFVQYRAHTVDVCDAPSVEVLFAPFNGGAIVIAQLLSPCSVKEFPSEDPSLEECLTNLRNSNFVLCSSEDLVTKLKELLQLLEQAYSKHFYWLNIPAES